MSSCASLPTFSLWSADLSLILTWSESQSNVLRVVRCVVRSFLGAAFDVVNVTVDTLVISWFILVWNKTFIVIKVGGAVWLGVRWGIRTSDPPRRSPTVCSHSCVHPLLTWHFQEGFRIRSLWNSLCIALWKSLLEKLPSSTWLKRPSSLRIEVQGPWILALPRSPKNNCTSQSKRQRFASLFLIFLWFIVILVVRFFASGCGKGDPADWADPISQIRLPAVSSLEWNVMSK